MSATGRYIQFGFLVFFELAVTITTNGSAAGGVIATLPVNPSPSFAYVANGRANAVSGKMLQGRISNVVPNAVVILNYDNSYAGASGESLIVSGFYEAAESN